MLLSQQPRSCIRSMPAHNAQQKADYHSTRLFKSLLSPAVTICIEATFTSDSDMAYWSAEPFDIGLLHAQPSAAGRQPNCHSQNADNQAKPTYSTERWEDEELDIRRHAGSPNENIDVFEVQYQQSSTLLGPRQLDQIVLANKHESPDLWPTNSTPSNTQSSRQDPDSCSTNTQAVKIKTRRLHSPVKSPQRDPRTLFGSRETHLPWVTKLSPNRFSMTVSPDMLARDAPPPKSIWDADDDEFDRWPTAFEAREELNTIQHNATTKRSTFIRPPIPDLSVREQIAEAGITPMGDVTRTSHELQQTILELEDMDCGNPAGPDLHDAILAPFRSRDYPVLPHHAPPRHMHVLDAKAYTTSADSVVKAARPRLADAVATVLAYTSPECLADFLNPEVKVFEWRRLINCVLVRRVGRDVVVGTYYNFGTTYQWGYLVKSRIDDEGAWTEKWASVIQGTTPVGKDGVLFELYEADGAGLGVQPDDEEFALYVGRQLADFLLGYEVWNYYKWWRYRVEWEADGRVTDAREKNRYPAGLTFD